MSQPIAALRSYTLGLALFVALAAGCDKKSGAADGAAPASSAKITCMTVRIETNGWAKKLADRKTRAARESSDAGFIADLVEQARLFKEAGAELTKTGEVSPDPELKKIVIDLGAVHTELGQNATALAEAAKAGDKAKEQELAKKGDAISKRQGEALDKFENYCDSHGAPPGAK
jgi:hypothetical protein